MVILFQQKITGIQGRAGDFIAAWLEFQKFGHAESAPPEDLK